MVRSGDEADWNERSASSPSEHRGDDPAGPEDVQYESSHYDSGACDLAWVRAEKQEWND